MSQTIWGTTNPHNDAVIEWGEEWKARQMLPVIEGSKLMKRTLPDWEEVE